ncbi:hypothetical protein PZA11_000494 [Diplocarpon coronariae]|uniref:2EXR domain-containing protein n=1 Tax=Diplocarpon coronariae TaxID=2795749 RepID=A0A218ZID6_9HELO|nr:hypothetical protein JHW43_008278 [Diplocarpon mali]OWP06986.1 hypothetical protein B2J93_7720 [Marssonina coronariae]
MTIGHCKNKAPAGLQKMPKSKPPRSMTPCKTPNQMSPLEKRTQLIDLRLESLERGRKLLHPHEKWPTVKGVKAHKERQAKFVARAKAEAEASDTPPCDISLLKCATEKSDIKISIPNAESSPEVSTTKASTEAWLQMLPSFPFPISRHRHLTSFPQFPLLPTELRLEIWEIALYNPKFIEIQYCTDFYDRTFLNLPYDQPLSAVCRESRETASKIKFRAAGKLSMLANDNFRHPLLNFAQRQQAIQQNGDPHPWPRPIVRLCSSRDTVFFRTLDLFSSDPLGDVLRSICGPNNNIQHLALPLNIDDLAQARTWAPCLRQLRRLRSVTFMVGSKEKSWTKSGAVELRPLDQWFADGRNWWIDRACAKEEIIDVAEVATWLRTPDPSLLGALRRALPRSQPARICHPISIRIVAWKKT